MRVFGCLEWDLSWELFFFLRGIGWRKTLVLRQSFTRASDLMFSHN